MRNIAALYRDRLTGEYNLTAMTEEAANYFNQDQDRGPLDDPDHWIWECAPEVTDTLIINDAVDKWAK